MDFALTFGSGQPVTGLLPTFITWQFADGTTGAPPGITARIAATGIYQFTVSNVTTAIFFVADGATTSIGAEQRYIRGSIDPGDFIGSPTDSIGSTSVDPSTVFGYLKRLQELLEGDATYNKTSGVWDLFNRGSTTLLRQKTLTNTSALATKS